MSKYVGFRLGKVHESHVISEYYCGRCGWPVTDHDSFCPECGGAFRECDASDLEAENAELREQVAEACRQLGGAWVRCSELRELVEDMLDCIEICNAFGRPPTSEMCKEFAQRADELGIEVDE